MAQESERNASRPSYAGTRSHGRGGAGNISSKPRPATEADDLKTPHIKSNTFTTGRGGAGNMKTSDPANPNAARVAQDVETPAHHNKEMQGTYHWGRGGEGNMMSVGEKKEDKKKEDGGLTRVKSRDAEEKRAGSKERSGSFKGVVDKGREMLGLGGKKERESLREKAGESAVE